MADELRATYYPKNETEKKVCLAKFIFVIISVLTIFAIVGL